MKLIYHFDLKNPLTYTGQVSEASNKMKITKRISQQVTVVLKNL